MVWQLNTVNVVSLTIIVGGGVKQKMVGRNDVAIVAALHVVAQVVQNQPNYGGNDEFRHLGKKFLRKYFPKDVRGKKEIEFLELKIYEEDSKAQSAHYKGQSKRKGKQNLNRGKPYNALADKGKQRVVGGKRPSGGGVSTPLKCYRCDELGHCVSECKSDVKKCYKYGKSGHLVADCKENMLGLVLYSMSGEMVIETSAKGSVTTTSVCLNYPVLIFDKDFSVDLICLPLDNLYVILGMNWFEFNHVYINCYNKSVQFLTPGEEEEVSFLSTRELKEILEKEAQVVRDFPEVFPDDISDVPLEREVEFSIDLVLGTIPISMEPYKMFASELAKLKKQLEDLLEKRFVRPSVSP
ncbi:uncharacterized protein LOC127136385 [Lathyrus oleraceus]|uniref:uncharacterized protein LOC127136385 n=1 Tax=Pisum sativum TaxID=3888 RepID=UPI0021CE4C6D|nr:uncharacterized protein LOC127136385 [Pisum sativum]